jgi:hypothetical protein
MPDWRRAGVSISAELTDRDLQPGGSIRVPRTGSGWIDFRRRGGCLPAGQRALIGDHISRFSRPAPIPLLFDC